MILHAIFWLSNAKASSDLPSAIYYLAEGSTFVSHSLRNNQNERRSIDCFEFKPIPLGKHFLWQTGIPDNPTVGVYDYKSMNLTPLGTVRTLLQASVDVDEVSWAISNNGQALFAMVAPGGETEGKQPIRIMAFDCKGIKSFGVQVPMVRLTKIGVDLPSTSDLGLAFSPDRKSCAISLAGKVVISEGSGEREPTTLLLDTNSNRLHRIAAGLCMGFDSRSRIYLARKRYDGQRAKINLIRYDRVGREKILLQNAHMVSWSYPWIAALTDIEPMYDKVFHVDAYNVETGKHVRHKITLPGMRESDFGSFALR